MLAMIIYWLEVTLEKKPELNCSMTLVQSANSSGADSLFEYRVCTKGMFRVWALTSSLLARIHQAQHSIDLGVTTVYLLQINVL